MSGNSLKIRPPRSPATKPPDSTDRSAIDLQIQTLLKEAAKRGEPLGRTASQLQELLNVHGRTQMTAAVADALNRGVPHPNAVRMALERQRQGQTPPPLGVALPEHVRERDIAVRPHSLSGYDQLIGDQGDAND